MKYAKVQEETRKNKVTHDFFGGFDCTEVIEKIDFVVKCYGNKLLDSYLLWAEAKNERHTVAVTPLLTSQNNVRSSH